MNHKGKRGLKEQKEKNQIVTGTLPAHGEILRYEIVEGKAPLTKLKPTRENLHALEAELREAESSLRHYHDKVQGLQKLISKLSKKLPRQ